MWKVPLFKIYHDSNDIEAVNSVIKRGQLWAIGPEIERFEKMISNYIDSKYCVVFNSGTSALHAVLLACKIKNGMNVAVPSFSFISTANSVLFVNAKPVFVDIEEENLGIDPLQLDSVVSKQKIDAVIPVHYAGLPCKIEEIVETAKRKKILVIEDAAESLGAKYKGEKTGTFGTAAILSFAPNKIITTGEGGAVVTDSKEIYERLLLVRSHGRNDVGNYFTNTKQSEYVEIGYNFRMPSMVASLGISQLKKINKIIKMRKKKASFYNKQFFNIKELELPRSKRDFSHVYQMYSIRVKNGKRDNLAKALKTAGIMSKIYFEPIHLTSLYRRLFKFSGGELPVTEKISREILTLPLYPHMNKSDMELVISGVRKFFEK